MLEMWLLIVLVDNPSLAAIARLDSPDATSSSTSCSRGVSSAEAGLRRRAQCVQRASGQAGSEDRLAGRHSADRPQQVVSIGALLHIT